MKCKLKGPKGFGSANIMYEKEEPVLNEKFLKKLRQADREQLYVLYKEAEEDIDTLWWHFRKANDQDACCDILNEIDCAELCMKLVDERLKGMPSPDCEMLEHIWSERSKP
jgi:hypothetical protein